MDMIGGDFMPDTKISIESFLENDRQRVQELINEFPQNIPLMTAAKFLGMHPDSLRQAIEDNQNIGLAWRKSGSLNRAFHIPTALFVRWYMKIF